MLMDEKSRRFFQPMWRRVMVLSLLAVWTIVEWFTGNPFWGVLTSGALGITIWMFIIDFRRVEKTSTDD